MKKPSLEQSYTLSQEPDGYVIINGVKYVKEEPKEETFVITKEQIHRLYDMADIQKMTLFKDEIKLLFPSAFESEFKLKRGMWLTRDAIENKWIVYVSANNDIYGINMEGEWFNSSRNDNTIDAMLRNKINREATKEEVEEALKAEAVRLKYKENLKHVECLCGFNKETSQKYYSDNKSIFYYEKHVNKLWVQDGSYLHICIFDSGKWAEIIQPKKMTQAEIEKKLGYNIEII